MRISDWSSAVCSSDLRVRGPVFDLAGDAQGRPAAIAACRVAGEFIVGEIGNIEPVAGRLNDIDALAALSGREFAAPDRPFARSGEIKDRKRAVSGKSVSVGVERGGSRNNTKKK